MAMTGKIEGPSPNGEVLPSEMEIDTLYLITRWGGAPDGAEDMYCIKICDDTFVTFQIRASGDEVGTEVWTNGSITDDAEAGVRVDPKTRLVLQNKE